MSKFDVGTRVRGIGEFEGRSIAGLPGTVTEVINRRIVEVEWPHGFKGYGQTSRNWSVDIEQLEPITEGGDQVKRRTFKLTKELPELTKGALVQEKCDDGTQDYIALDNSQIKYTLEDGRKSLTYPRKAVEDEPNYFVEVFAVEPAYMTREELDRFEAFKTNRAGKKSSARPVKAEAPTAKKRAPRAKKVVDVETFVRVYNSSRNSTSVARKLGINVGNVYNRASLARKQGFKLKTMKRPNTKVA
ncbi:hypothetical protein ACU5JM_08470 [Rhodococcus erythropolis]|uniref:hypothetical protein n=1 Tax=Rhodococcus erythropolis TaxID=1833 RepID=UPI00406BDAD2